MTLLIRVAYTALMLVLGGMLALWLNGQFGLIERLTKLGGGAENIEQTKVSVDPQSTQTLDVETLYRLLSLIDPKSRLQVIENEELFAKFVEQEAINQAVLRAAEANGADDSLAVQGLIDRAKQNVIAEAYLNQIVQHNLDERYPSDVQTIDFYEESSDRYRLPERVHIWQIFVPVGAEQASSAAKNAQALLKQVSADIAAKRLDFAAAAQKYSKHAQSLLNDGYMGLMNVNELLPEIRSAVEALEAGELSAPVRSPEGYHLLRRGERVAGTQLDFATVAGRVRQQLRNDAVKKVRDAALEKILQTYPVDVDQAEFPAWRTEMQRRDWTQALSTAPGLSPTAKLRTPASVDE